VHVLMEYRDETTNVNNFIIGQTIFVVQGRGTCSGGLPRMLGKNRGLQAREPSGRPENNGKFPDIKGNRETLFMLKMNIFLRFIIINRYFLYMR
jgi:hypothetical protein